MMLIQAIRIVTVTTVRRPTRRFYVSNMPRFGPPKSAKTWPDSLSPRPFLHHTVPEWCSLARTRIFSMQKSYPGNSSISLLNTKSPCNTHVLQGRVYLPAVPPRLVIRPALLIGRPYTSHCCDFLPRPSERLQFFVSFHCPYSLNESTYSPASPLYLW